MMARLIVAVVLVSLWGSGVAWADGIVRLDATTSTVQLTPYLSFYRDPTATMTLAAVRQDWTNHAFVTGSQRRPAFGFTPDAIWARWTVRNESPGPASWVIQLKSTRMDEVDFHLANGSGVVRQFSAGNARAPSVDQLDSIYPSFPVRLATGEQIDVFVRIRSETALQLPLEMTESAHLAGAQSYEQLIHAGFFGYLLALIILGFVFGLIGRERGFILYSASLICCFGSFFILSGYYVWLGLPGRAVVAKSGLILISECALFMLVFYLRYLLDLPRNLPAINRFVTWMLRGSAVLVLVLLATPYRIAYPVILIHMVFVGGASVVVAFTAWYKGLKVARFYALAWVLFWAFFGLSTYRHIAAESVSRPFWESAFAGTAISVIFFFISMGDRVREIRRAAARSQDQLLKLEQQASKDLRLKLRQEHLLIRDLHDGIGGLTANLAILAEMGRRDATADPERERFERISQLASDGSAEVRGLMGSLEARDMSWPDFFDECRRFARVALVPHGIEFTLAEAGFTDQVGPGVFPGLSLLRVVKESLTNSVKHSKGTHVRMQAEFTAKELRLTIRDNGQGFTSAMGGGRGLRNMESRIREMGGHMTTASVSGAEIVFVVPLPLALIDEQPVAPS